MDVLRGVRTLYISTMYIVDNQTVKNMYKPKSLENDKKLFLMTDLGFGDWHQLWVQFVATAVSVVYNVSVTYIIFKIVDKSVGVHVDKRVEKEGLDIYEHG